jgi:hypothetical protein
MVALNPNATARASIAAAISFQALLFALIFLRPELDPYWHTISEWAIGSWGRLMQIAFLISAASYSLLILLIRPLIKGVVGKLGLFLLAICAVALIGAGLFVTDPLTTPPDQMTVCGMIHSICAQVQLMLLPVAALLINLSLAKRDAKLPSTRKALVIAGFVPLIAFIGFVIHLTLYVIPLGDHAYGPNVPLGWPLRLVLLAYMVWLIVMALQATKLFKEAPS